MEEKILEALYNAYFDMGMLIEKTAQQQTQQAFRIGTKMAEREAKGTKGSPADKARRAKLKKLGHKSVSAGMAQRSRELRGEK